MQRVSSAGAPLPITMTSEFERTNPYADELKRTAAFICAPGKGILASDESNMTTGKRLGSVGLENTEATRQAWRELLYSAPGLGQSISGTIMFDETLFQSTRGGVPFVDVLKGQGILPGIKVDTGLQPIEGTDGETATQGLDGLGDRCKRYYQQGARFAKWRAVIKVDSGACPSSVAMLENAHGLARYAQICQVSMLSWRWTHRVWERVLRERVSGAGQRVGAHCGAGGDAGGGRLQHRAHRLRLRANELPRLSPPQRIRVRTDSPTPLGTGWQDGKVATGDGGWGWVQCDAGGHSAEAQHDSARSPPPTVSASRNKQHQCSDSRVLGSGLDVPTPAPMEVARYTLRTMKRSVPAAVPGIHFLSGGMSEEEATLNLQALQSFGPTPWALTFSYGRALQSSTLKMWAGKVRLPPLSALPGGTWQVAGAERGALVGVGCRRRTGMRLRRDWWRWQRPTLRPR